jgi:hypothetical protein
MACILGTQYLYSGPRFQVFLKNEFGPSIIKLKICHKR